MNIVFFGSTHDSVMVLETLNTYHTVAHRPPLDIKISAVVTQPPRPIGRKQEITPTTVELWAKNNHITALSFPSNAEKPWLYADEETVIDTLQTLKADLFISASYGQKIPWASIAAAGYGGINIHPSLIPRWRGADPVPWAILAGDAQIGVTVMQLGETFDTGLILAQQKIPLKETDFPDALRSNLFTLGARLLCDYLAKYIANPHQGQKQNPEHMTYARKITREDGFVPWEEIQLALQGKDVDKEHRRPIFQQTEASWPVALNHGIRALSPWPGIWTLMTIAKAEKRIKILTAHIEDEKLMIDTVQIEGKNPSPFSQFQQAYNTGKY